MFMVSLYMFAVTAEENKQLLKTSLFKKKKKKEQFNRENKAGKKAKERCRLEAAAMKQGLPLLCLAACDPGRVHCVTERE